jgi:hypothetical protein
MGNPMSCETRSPRSDPFSPLGQEQFIAEFHRLLGRALLSAPYTDCHKLTVKVGGGDYLCRASTYINLLREDSPIPSLRDPDSWLDQMAFDRRCLEANTALISAQFSTPSAPAFFAALHMGVRGHRSLRGSGGTLLNEAFSRLDNTADQNQSPPSTADDQNPRGAEAILELDGKLVGSDLTPLATQYPLLVSMLVGRVAQE